MRSKNVRRLKRCFLSIFCYFLLIYLLTIFLVQFSLKSVSLNVLCYKSITSYLLNWYTFMGPLLIYEWQLPLLVKRVACMFCMKMIRNIASSFRLCSVIFRAWIFFMLRPILEFLIICSSSNLWDECAKKLRVSLFISYRHSEDSKPLKFAYLIAIASPLR